MTESTSNPDKIRFRCAGCSKAYSVPAEHAGRSTKCPACGERMVVPRPEPVALPAKIPESIDMSCGLCGTRMNVPAQYIGKKVKCPDCHTLTEIKPPAPEPEKQRPAALDGEQYELYDVDNQPTGEELRAKQPKLIAVECSLCETLMHAPESQLGQEITCPDCGMKTRVVEPVVQEEQVWSEGDGEEFEVEAPVETAHVDYVAEHSGAAPLGYREALDDKARAAKEARKPPSDAMVRGVMTFWASPGAVASLIGIGIGFTIWCVTLVFGMILFGGAFGPLARGVGISFMLGGGVMFLGWLGIASAIVMAVLGSSLDGNPKVLDWPGGDPRDWFTNSPRMVLAISFAVAPGGVLASLVAPEFVTVMLLTSFWLLIPWTILSQLEGNSAWILFSPKLLATIAWAPKSWAIYYAYTLLLIGGSAAFCFAVFHLVGPWSILFLPLVGAFALMTCARLLGRLAWVFTDCMPESLRDPEPA